MKKGVKFALANIAIVVGSGDLLSTTNGQAALRMSDYKRGSRAGARDFERAPRVNNAKRFIASAAIYRNSTSGE